MDHQPRDKHSELFMGLVVSFQVSALQYLGKLINPMTGTAERDLAGAAASIDMLDMLYVKTKGNLNPDEVKVLEETLSHLKLNYVAEANKPSPPPDAQQAASPVEETKPPEKPQ